MTILDERPLDERPLDGWQIDQTRPGRHPGRGPVAAPARRPLRTGSARPGGMRVSSAG